MTTAVTSSSANAGMTVCMVYEWQALSSAGVVLPEAVVSGLSVAANLLVSVAQHHSAAIFEARYRTKTTAKDRIDGADVYSSAGVFRAID